MKRGFILITALLMLFSIELVGQIPLVYDFEFDIISNYQGQLKVWTNTIDNPGLWSMMIDPPFQGTTTIYHTENAVHIYQVKVHAINSVMSVYNEIREVEAEVTNYFLIDLREPFQEPIPDPK